MQFSMFISTHQKPSELGSFIVNCAFGRMGGTPAHFFFRGGISEPYKKKKKTEKGLPPCWVCVCFGFFTLFLRARVRLVRLEHFMLSVGRRVVGIPLRVAVNSYVSQFPDQRLGRHLPFPNSFHINIVFYRKNRLGTGSRRK